MISSRAVLPAALLLLLTLFFVGGATIVFAEESSVTYPIADLGGCTDKGACKTYCDDIAHINECITFAEANGLMNAEDAERGRMFAKIGEEGPGSCTSVESCESYCEDMRNIEECISFGEKHGLMPEEELQEAKRIMTTLKSGVTLPGGCTSKHACEKYCSQASNMRECITFGESAGLIPPEELQEAKKMVAYLESGGTMPGGCSGENECKTYCEDEAHSSECVDFALKAGFIPPEQAEMIRKTGGKGPGGCRGRACETYCEDPTNRQTCIEFSMEHGLMSKEDQQQMEEGMESARRAIEESAPEVVSCLEGVVGSDVIAKMRTGTFPIGPDIGEAMRTCFEKQSKSGWGSGGHPENDRPEERPAFSGDVSMPPEMDECARSLFGDDYRERLMSNELNYNDFEARTKACVGERNPYREPSNGSEGPSPREYEERRYENADDRGSYENRDIRGDNERMRREEGVPPPESYNQPPQEYRIETSGSYDPSQNYAPYQEPKSSVEPIRYEEPVQRAPEPVQYQEPAHTEEPAPAPAPSLESAPTGDASTLGAQVITAFKILLRR
ncbi:hypothetical protein A3D62_00595 [Candidatus Kaiserbacteria bacterium RIFCSPHIGHO2_02_FULL_49_11]|uniref:Uncharacterized protein n=1 Tax=Candidatus Kaiserbacteria bacterium RIFCSPHIGHO2_02_FULL_49_11 TaxID=1798489 RepID=A0A1F6CZL3_9BACT|nr:MAG: hypothetical protein A3D62_00595 [Candidatus Kaiserbacteria bacterium RIFCSPHIGHO2_02_FULL_49_11]